MSSSIEHSIDSFKKLMKGYFVPGTFYRTEIGIMVYQAYESSASPPPAATVWPSPPAMQQILGTNVVPRTYIPPREKIFLISVDMVNARVFQAPSVQVCIRFLHNNEEHSDINNITFKEDGCGPVGYQNSKQRFQSIYKRYYTPLHI